MVEACQVMQTHIAEGFLPDFWQAQTLSLDGSKKAPVDAVISCALLQGQDRSVLFTMHCLAGAVPEPVRYYCTNIRCILAAHEDTTDPVRLLRGLYRSARPEELSHVASGCSGKQLLPHVLKAKLVDQIMEHVITGQEIRQRKWCEVGKANTAQVSTALSRA